MIRFLSTLFLVLGFVVFATSCAVLESYSLVDYSRTHVTAISHADLNTIISGISPMAKADAVRLLQEKSNFTRSNPDSDEMNFSTNLVTASAFTYAFTHETATREPLGGIVLSRKTRRSTNVCAWTNATNVKLVRHDFDNEPGKFEIMVYVVFSQHQHREESSPGGALSGEPFAVESDVTKGAGELPIARVGDTPRVMILENHRPHQDLAPILSAIKALTGLAPTAESTALSPSQNNRAQS
jgi:hypothetical protein